MNSGNPIRIAVDAMGGDFGPSVVVPGALVAQRELGDRCRIALYGDKAQIRDEMSKAGGDPTSFEIVHAPDNIGMSEAPAAAIRRRTESSIVMASRAMRAGEADAFVSAGSTGAVAAAGLLLVGRLPKVDRPAIASLYPTQGGAGLLLDVGANVDCKPRHLLQFGAMGRIYTEHVLGVQNPKVALLNIGEEASKGDELAQRAYALLAAHEPAFIGNIEGRHLFDGKADVLVMDGFVGNVVLKIMEGIAGFLATSVRGAIEGNSLAKLGALLMKPTMKEYGRRFNYAEYGGAPLLGCNGVIIICHGGSSEVAITNAIKVAEKGVRDRIPERIREEIEREANELQDQESQGGATAEGVES